MARIQKAIRAFLCGVLSMKIPKGIAKSNAQREVIVEISPIWDSIKSCCFKNTPK